MRGKVGGEIGVLLLGASGSRRLDLDSITQMKKKE